MVCCGAELILEECINKGSTLYDLNDYAVIQINDTHPSLIIPELIRRLEEKGIKFNDAVDIVSKVCAYTNHTILAEALEKWSMDSLNKVVPFLVPIIKKLDLLVKEKHQNKNLYIIDENSVVHMARMDIHFSFSVNGVAKLHTEILKSVELSDFYNIYPHKFNNKTNGITFRRWIVKSNHLLTEYLISLIGNDFIKNGERLKELEKYKNDNSVINRLIDIKKENKIKLIDYLNVAMGLCINENAITDVQVKRFHEYKRQQLNALYYIYKYLEIKRGNKPKTPVCGIFAGKAAPSYVMAKDIIHLILCLAQVVNNDEEVNKYLNIVMVENYNVTLAEKIIPGADISEQISLASKEASGTGNMKFMLNGALTLGTEDGANVEIKALAGEDNIYIFGEKSNKIIKLYKENSYNPQKYIENNNVIKECLDFITSKQMLSVGNKNNLLRLQKELSTRDCFMTLLDFESYRKTKDLMLSDYEDKMRWGRKMLLNISNSGYFSSDRTIGEYNKEIWHLK
jgi:starch phosphorylase